MQRVGILHPGQTSDHKRTRILRAQKFDFTDPVEKFLTLLIRGLLLRAIRRHVVSSHFGQRLPPPFTRRSFAGVLEGGCEVDSALLFLFPMTARAVSINEWGHDLFEGLSGVGLQCGKIRLTRSLRCATQDQRQRKDNEAPRHHATAKYFGSLHSFPSFEWDYIRGSAYALAELRGGNGRT